MAGSELRQRKPAKKGQTKKSAGDSQKKKGPKTDEENLYPLWKIALFGGTITSVIVAIGLYLFNQIHALPDPTGPAIEYENRLKYMDLPIEADIHRREAIVEAIKDSYSAYERDAFGYDNYHPISHTGSNLAKEPLGYFIIDVLDTLLMVGMEEEYQRAADFVKNLSFDIDDKFHTFETTIRVMGGLLSAYNLRKQDTFLLDKAVDLGDRLLGAFETPSGLPLSFVNLHTREGIPDTDNMKLASIAEVGSLQLEFKYLSELAGNPIYWEKVTHVMDVIRDAQPPLGLVPLFIDPQRGSLMTSVVRLGSRADSYYEYLLKQYLQTNKTEPQYKKMWDESVEGIRSALLAVSENEKLTYSREIYPLRKKDGVNWEVTEKQDHLVCFLGGLWMLGAVESNPTPPLQISKLPFHEENEFLNGMSLVKTCYKTYEHFKTGLGPEIVHFHKKTPSSSPSDMYIKRNIKGKNAPIDARNILRPETVESLFYAFRLTADPGFRDWSWKIFKAFGWCKVESGGYASIHDVDQVPPSFEDRMETFWISETLKYLYLSFTDATEFPLDKYVFNTEAHPFPIFTPTVV